jgi:hypothetical protein
VNRSRLLPHPRFASLALLGALTFGPACKGDEPAPKADGKPAPATTDSQTNPNKPAPTVPGGLVANPVDSPAVAEVGEVVATLQLPSGTAMSDIAAIIDSVQPGGSAMLKMQVPSMLEKAAGFDVAKTGKLDSPISVVVLDPSAHPQPVAVLIEAKDAAAMTEAAKAAGHEVEQRDNLLLVGPADVVSAAKDFAFDNLTKYPDHTEIVVYPQKLMTTIAPVMQQMLSTIDATMAAQPGGEGVSKMMKGYVDGAEAMVEQTQRVVISVGSGPDSNDFIMRMYPVEGSVFASFVAAQVASDHALLSKLPSGSATILMSGNFNAGAARDPFVKFSAELMAPMYGGMTVEEWTAMLAPWLDNLDGRFATSVEMAISPAGPANIEMRGLMGATDSAKLLVGWREMLDKMTNSGGFEMMGMKITAKHETKAIEYDGVEIDLYSSSIDTSAMPDAQAKAIEQAGTANQAMHLAAFDGYAAMATADAEGKVIRSVVDAARGKQTLELSGVLAKVVDVSKQRGDSMLVYFDVGALVENSGAAPKGPIPFKAIAMTMGAENGGLSMRMSMIK